MPVFVNLNLQGDPLVWINLTHCEYKLLNILCLILGCIAYKGIRFMPQCEPLCRNGRVCSVRPFLPLWHSAQLMWFAWRHGDFCLEVISSCCSLTQQILLFVDPHTLILMSILSGKFGGQHVGLLWSCILSLAHSVYMQIKRQLEGQIDGNMLNCWLFFSGPYIYIYIFLCTNSIPYPFLCSSIPYACFLIILNVVAWLRLSAIDND